MKSLTYKVLDSKGAEVGTIELDPAIFGAPILEDLVHQTVRWQRAKMRAGTHSTLTKGVMKGGNRKPRKQKGSGRARCGSNTSPLWVGGAVAHGPHPRSYEFRLSKRVRKQALASVLSDKVRTSRLIVLDQISNPSGKTKDFAKLLKDVGVTDSRVALVLDAPGGAEAASEKATAKKSSKKGAAVADTNSVMRSAVSRSARNIDGLIAFPVGGTNVYDLARTKFLVCSKAGVKELEKRAQLIA